MTTERRPAASASAAGNGHAFTHVCTHDARTSWSAWRADVRANRGSISKVALAVYRVGHVIWRRAPRSVLWRVYRVIDLVVVKLVIGADLPASACLGAGLRLEHGGKGVVLNEDVIVGSGVTIYHQVTLGWRDVGNWEDAQPVPHIEDEVVLGAGAKVLGGVTIGRGAVVGANAVVLIDVPAGGVAVGIPARVVS
jgi:serine O-acetyltransferase